MKKSILLSLLLTSSLFAADYSTMSLEELLNERGSVLDDDNKESFRSEMQSRMQELTPEERSSYRDLRRGENGSVLRDGSGSGNMYRGSRGRGGRF